MRITVYIQIRQPYPYLEASREDLEEARDEISPIHHIAFKNQQVTPIHTNANHDGSSVTVVRLRAYQTLCTSGDSTV